MTHLTSSAVPGPGEAPPVPRDPPPPPVVRWYRAYAAAFGVMYVGVMGLGVIMLFAGAFGDMDKAEAFITGVICLALGVPFAVASFVGAFAPPRPWSWIVGICLIALGMTSACCMPAAIPLLIYWLKPETKAHFGRT